MELETVNNSWDTYETSVLKRIVYLYYPINISAVENTADYLKTKEFINLKASIDSSIAQSQLDKMEKDIAEKYIDFRFQKVSANNWLDRAECYWLDNIIDNTLFRYRLQISKLIPYFVVYLTKIVLNLDNHRIFAAPPEIVDAKEYSQESRELINFLIDYVKMNLGLNTFNIDLDEYIVDDVSFQDINFGKFTLYNAFFTNNLK